MSSHNSAIVEVQCQLKAQFSTALGVGFGASLGQHCSVLVMTGFGWIWMDCGRFGVLPGWVQSRLGVDGLAFGCMDGCPGVWRGCAALPLCAGRQTGSTSRRNCSALTHHSLLTAASFASNNEPSLGLPGVPRRLEFPHRPSPIGPMASDSATVGQPFASLPPSSWPLPIRQHARPWRARVRY